MSTVTKVRSSETLNEAGQFANGVASSLSMLAAMQPVDKLKTDLFSGRVPSLEGAYRGFGANCTSVVPVQGVAYAAYGAALRRLAPNGNPTEKQKEQARVFATTAAVPLATLFEGVKVRQQLKKGVGPFQVVRQVVAQDGYRGLFKGAGPTWFRDYVWFKGMLEMRNKVEQAQPKALTNKKVRKVAADAQTGMGVGILTASSDMIKTKMQGDGWDESPEAMKERPKGTYATAWKTMQRVLKDEGVMGLVVPKGTGARVGFLGGAVVFMGAASDVFPQYFPEFFHKDSNI